ncbi:DUF928 domain-containing protein [Microseira wollei]|uniref:DUF928 domain-containing protein n=1 Tax=Microseira wollei NIES-4236 TaxID=2530354 RepID=A0AAV3XKT4_9CYAN|nr:DUF928 domain-containing protein [Microseira wollei]GET42178.1 hypothetical protein MiSe_69920 [Microseira wollei NIES-4236]
MAMHSYRNLATLSIAITLELFIGSPLATWAQSMRSQFPEVAINWTPPNRGTPAQTEGAGTRDQGTCAAGETTPNPPLTALMPINSLALTVADRPTFFVYVPATSAKMAEFVLKDENDDNVFTTKIDLTRESGIVSISLPANANPLETGKTYRWYFDLVCNSGKRIFLDRLMVERVEPSQALQRQLQQAKERDRPDVYAQNGLWYDTLMALAQMRRSPSNNATLTADWKQLLESAGLKEIADKPLIDCCTIQSSTVSNPVETQR